MQQNIGYTYKHKADFDSYLQKGLKNTYLKDALNTAINASGVALAPLDTLLFDVLKTNIAACPNSSGTVACGLESLASALFLTRGSYKQYIDKELPLSAWLQDNEDIQRAILNYPYYQKMRQRVWEQSIPADSKLRWPKGSGKKAGQIKPDWVIELQEKNEKKKKFQWLPSL